MREYVLSRDLDDNYLVVLEADRDDKVCIRLVSCNHSNPFLSEVDAKNTNLIYLSKSFSCALYN